MPASLVTHLPLLWPLAVGTGELDAVTIIDLTPTVGGSGNGDKASWLEVDLLS